MVGHTSRAVSSSETTGLKLHSVVKYLSCKVRSTRHCYPACRILHMQGQSETVWQPVRIREGGNAKYGLALEILVSWSILEFLPFLGPEPE